MLTADDFQARLRARVFEPFRVHVSSGEVYDIRDPSWVMGGRRFIIVGIPAPDLPTVIARDVKIAIMHVTGLEALLAAQQPPTGNGAAGPG